jgi:hypothetical protein
MPPRRRPLAAALALAALAAALGPAGAQQTQPLAGAGDTPPPGNGTTRVWVSVYLDRLLDVSESNYEFHAVMYFYLSWVDPRAKLTLAANARKMQVRRRRGRVGVG